MGNHAYMTLLGAAIPTCVMLAGAIVLFARRRNVCSSLQLLGAASLTMVVLTHLAETFDLMPWMRWGSPHGAGHYLDLGSAVLGLSLFPAGYFFDALGRFRAR